jgi:predicted acylesterase/phospholipase RssA
MNRHIGVAISGGGHRATLWGIGPLLYLADAGKNAEVGAISSVSGGSITNGVIAHNVDYPYASSAELDEALRPLTRHVAFTGLFFWGPATNAYVVSLFSLLGIGVAALVTGLVLIGIGGVGVVSGLVTLTGIAVIAVAARYFEHRSAVVDKALAKTHFSRNGKPTRLADVSRGVDHVICSTELQSAGHLYFAPTFLYSYAFGAGAPHDLALSTAVQASACLPGAFSTRRIKATPYFAADPDRAEMVLTDGGVYDNMADQWLAGLARRVERAPDLPVVTRSIDEMIVINGSAPTAFSKSVRSRLVLLAELATMQRVNSVMYQVTTERRRAALVDQWMHATETGKGMRGALVHIAQTPYTVADAYSSNDGDIGTRARSVIALLGDDAASRARWTALARTSRGTPTVLRKLGRDSTLDLLEMSYTLSMCNLHVLLGYPLRELPGRPRFERLLGEQPVTAPTSKVLDLTDPAPVQEPVRRNT